MKFALILLLLFITNLHSQAIDSLPSERTPVIPDTLTSQQDSITLPADTILADTTAADTSAVFSGEKIQPDTLYPVVQQPFYSSSLFINREIIDKIDYRYAADFFRAFNQSFLRARGFIGQPEELILYGSGFNGTSYFEDGTFINSRISNSFDLNLIQSEDVDSVEIIPSPRGFLYGPYNNNVSVNIISRDFISSAPYTRIKYYEGPFGEAMADGMFNGMFFDRLILSFDITNRKFDSSYANSEFGIWQGKFKLKYLAGSAFSVTGAYTIIDSERGLNGGVDADSILRITDDLKSILFNLSAVPEPPVVFPARDFEVKQHNFKLKFLGEYLKYFKSEFNLYYRFNQELLNSAGDFVKNKIDISGLSFKQNYEKGILNAGLNGYFDHYRLKISTDENTNTGAEVITADAFSLAPEISFNLFDGKFKPAFFYKFGSIQNQAGDSRTDNSYNGFGLDISGQPLNNMKIYLGYSEYESYFRNAKIKTFEAGFNYNFRFITTGFNFFNREGVGFIRSRDAAFEDLYNMNRESDMIGIGSTVNLQLWEFLLETSTTFYISNRENNDFVSGLPDLSFRGGIYFSDILFNNNLDLKTGFYFTYVGKQKINLPPVSVAYIPPEIDPSYQVDFTLSGEIQERAVLYFTWENLLGEKYYIVPFYPMRERGIRFGVSWELFN